MSRLVMVSNRLPIGRPTGAGGELEIPAGGLVSALLAALERAGDSLWLGWDPGVQDPNATSRHTIRGVELLGLGLSRREVSGHYLGFCNGALWPLLHCFQGRVRFEPEHLDMYKEVQRRYARTLLTLLSDEDLVWIHDYHLFLLARELRRNGFRGRLGFFLHTPFPPHELWTLLPDSGEFLEAMLAHDLIGFHTQGYIENFASCCERDLGARTSPGAVGVPGHSHARLGVYPAGIQAGDFAPSRRALQRPRRSLTLARLVGSQVAVLGVDRLDYTKGLGERFEAFEQFLLARPEWRRRISLVQIASPSRSALPWYQREKQVIELLAGRINGEMGEPDWIPIRYLYRSFAREALGRFYRGADVGIVTPLRDGMNLVAKEFVAAQDPNNPGVLVLSRFAGAAEQMVDAVLVNPFSPMEVAEALATALEMPLEERRRRHAALLAHVCEQSASAWAEQFTTDLRRDEGVIETQQHVTGLPWEPSAAESSRPAS
jgi:trehalose 6-phosphate synthase